MNRLVLMVLKNAFAVPGLYARLCRYAKHTDEYPEEEQYLFIQSILKRAVAAGNIDLQVSGTENLPQENGFLLCGNHQGMFDPLAICVSCDRPLGAVYKKELKDIPFVRQVVTCTKSFAMDREDVRQSLAVIQAVTQELRKGRNYLIFPEGTRSRSGNQMGAFHGGSFRCAVKAGCPIVPMALIDCWKVLDQKGSAPVSVQIHYLKPILYEEYANLKTVELAELVRSRIGEAIRQHTAPETP